MKYSAQDEQHLFSTLLDPALADDPEAFVDYVYPWGEKGGPLEKYPGPRAWQRRRLRRIKEVIQENQNLELRGLIPKVYKSAVASGRGPGKSAFVGWLIHWFMSTRLGGTCIVTANTEQQLKSRTWAELGKWVAMSLNAHWFEVTATLMRPDDWFSKLLVEQLGIDSKYYYAQAQLWSEDNPDAFAGAHNPRGMMVLFDEASGIPQVIWDVAEGFFTDICPHRYWFVFSNPRRNTGAFFECFHKHRAYWEVEQIDSRTVEGLDPKVYQEIIDKHGADSYQAFVEVYGRFPMQSDKQFIGMDVAYGARDRELVPDDGAPLVLGVDVARSGSDKSVLRFRRGRDARSIPAQKFNGLDNMQLAHRVAEAIDRHQPDAVCIDAGNGTGVIDRLRELGYRVHEIWFGGKAESREFANKRAEMWGLAKAWLMGGCIPDDQELIDDLIGPEYHFAGKGGDQIALESKEQMKKRGLASPDDGDALALTFAVRVARHDAPTSRKRARARCARDVDYVMFR